MNDSTLDLFCEHEDAQYADKYAMWIEELASKYNDSTLDLFCEHEDAQYADKYAMWIEELASKYEVTCDYIIQEFILD